MTRKRGIYSHWWTTTTDKAKQLAALRPPRPELIAHSSLLLLWSIGSHAHLLESLNAVRVIILPKRMTKYNYRVCGFAHRHKAYTQINHSSYNMLKVNGLAKVDPFENLSELQVTLMSWASRLNMMQSHKHEYLIE